MVTMQEPNPSMLGARPRPHDPKETKYRLVVPAQVDMSDVVSLGEFMPDVEEASQTGGSCTGQTVKKLMECLFRIQHGSGVAPQYVDAYVIYWLARALQNFFGQGEGNDTGAYLADAFDVALPGVGRDDLWPTPASVSEPPPQAVLDDAPNQDWLLGHQPMYASDPSGFLGGIWTAHRERKPVGIAMAWYDNWFGHQAVLPDNTGALAGYHAISGYASIPAGLIDDEGGEVLRNSWGAYTDITPLKGIPGLNAQPGDVYIKARHFTNGTVQEVRAATAEKIVTPPDTNCDDKVRQAFDEARYLAWEVREQYKTQTARNAVTKVMNAIDMRKLQGRLPI